jgi:hypothetical protein
MAGRRVRGSRVGSVGHPVGVRASTATGDDVRRGCERAL